MSRGSGRDVIRRSAAAPRSLVEIGVALAASTIMTLMVVGGGIAAERMTSSDSPTAEYISPAPDSLPQHETT